MAVTPCSAPHLIWSLADECMLSQSHCSGCLRQHTSTELRRTPQVALFAVVFGRAVSGQQIRSPCGGASRPCASSFRQTVRPVNLRISRSTVSLASHCPTASPATPAWRYSPSCGDGGRGRTLPQPQHVRLFSTRRCISHAQGRCTAATGSAEHSGHAWLSCIAAVHSARRPHGPAGVTAWRWCRGAHAGAAAGALRHHGRAGQHGHHA